MTATTIESTEDGEVIDLSGDMNALAVLSRAEIDQQISTAKRYPRSIATAKRRMIEMACLDQGTAKSCGYALKRTGQDGKIAWIEGPSIRMAEIAVSSWGNIRYGARVISEDDRFIVAQGVCHDLETNVYSTMEVRRRITNRSGRKYGDDMVGVTANAACAIAARNAVMKVIPRAIINQAYEEAMKVAEGDAKTFAGRRAAAVAEFAKLGVTLEELMAALDKRDGGAEDIDTKDLRRLHGLLTAINDGESTVEQIFRPQRNQPSEATEKLNERLTKRPVSEGQKFEADPAEAARQQLADHFENTSQTSAASPQPPAAVAPTGGGHIDHLRAEAQAAGKPQPPGGPPHTHVSGAEDSSAPGNRGGAGQSGPAPQASGPYGGRDGPVHAAPAVERNLAEEATENELCQTLNESWQGAHGACVDAAERAGMSRSDAAKGIAAHVKLALGRKGREDETTPAQRRALYDACAAGRLTPGGAISPGK